MRVSESYVIGVDIDNGEYRSVLTVGHYTGTKIHHINQFYDNEAEELYENLTGIKKKEENTQHTFNCDWCSEKVIIKRITENYDAYSGGEIKPPIGWMPINGHYVCPLCAKKHEATLKTRGLWEERENESK